MLGALNPISLEVVTVENTSYVNANTVCEMLEKLAAKSELPVTVALDNAKYQRCELVRERARKLGVELLFLPSYSPQLNLIERYWRLVKKECLYCKYYPTFSSFQTAISEFIAVSSTQHHEQMKSLLTLKFQTFGNVNILASNT